MGAGSLQSGQPSDEPPPPHKRRPEPRQNLEAEGVVFDSQQSEQGHKKRRTSYVQQPIGQQRSGLPATRARTRMMGMRK